MDDLTLDPPGSIAVVGAGPLGIETSLYGRFLGYDVTLVEAEVIANSLRPHRDQPLPMSPDRCLSPLAISALQSQYPDFATSTKPLTIGQWVDDALVPLTETDLLRGRLMCPARVTQIETIKVQWEDEEPSQDIPPDFRLFFQGSNQLTLDCEAVILAGGQDDQINLSFETPAAYLFRIRPPESENAEDDFWAGLRQIVSVFAQLAGRADLDLYRPRRN